MLFTNRKGGEGGREGIRRKTTSTRIDLDVASDERRGRIIYIEQHVVRDVSVCRYTDSSGIWAYRKISHDRGDARLIQNNIIRSVISTYYDQKIIDLRSSYN